VLPVQGSSEVGTAAAFIAGWRVILRDPAGYPDFGQARTDDSPALVKNQLGARINYSQLGRQVARTKVTAEAGRIDAGVV
jgi:hypothetical protein